MSKDVAIVTQLVLRMLLATLLGSLLGYQREHQGKEAGMRTHMLVALGSTFFVLIPLQAGMPLGDLSRVLQGLISGIGFLVAGAILKQQDTEQIHGLTTAAGLWLTASVGVAVGLGRKPRPSWERCWPSSSFLSCLMSGHTADAPEAPREDEATLSKKP